MRGIWNLKWKTVDLLLITCMIWSTWASFCASVYLSIGESITWASGEWLCQNNQITAVNVICKLKKAQVKVYQLSQNKWAALGYPRWRKGIVMSLTVNELNSLRCSFQFSHSVVSESLWPHGLQHARPPCPSPTPGVYSNSCPLSWWCYPTI